MQLLSKDLGQYGNNEINLDWGYADFRFRDDTGLRLGRMKEPYGLYNQLRDIDMLRTPALLPQSVYDETWRDMFSFNGISLYGNRELGIVNTDFEFYAGTIDVAEDSAMFQILQKRTMLIDMTEKLAREAFITAGAGAAGAGAANTAKNNAAAYSLVNREHKTDDLTGFRFIFSPKKINGLRLGVSQFSVNADLGADVIFPAAFAGTSIDAKGTIMPYTIQTDYHMRTYSLEYTKNDWNFVTERQNGDYRMMNARLGNVNVLPGTFYDSGILGYYHQVSRQMNDKIQLGLAKSVYYPEKNDKDGTAQTAQTGRPAFYGWQKDTTFTVKYDVTYNWVLKLEYHDMDGVAQVRDFGGDTPKQNWNMWMLKATYCF
jgi:hypothetical protein